MIALLGTIQLKDQVREAVDHVRLSIESGRRVDHAEDPQPRRHPVQVAQRAFEAREDR
jgi:hypothetical protein